MKFSTTFQSVPDQRPLVSIFENSEIPNRGDINPSYLQSLFRNKFIQQLVNIKQGLLIFDDPAGQIALGDPHSELSCHIYIYQFDTYRKIALGGSNGAAQAYIDHLWSCDNPTALIRILIRNRAVLDDLESGSVKIAQLLLRIWHGRNHNSRLGSRKNIAAHYDLGNDFFRLFLDQQMMYSSALYHEGDTLDRAAERKMQRICDSLDLSEKDHLLEIGCGWGGFACYAAMHRNCRVTTITISREQYTEAKQRVCDLNLNDQVAVRLLDYRELQGQYDKVVSIEMVEAVGHHYLDGYFQTISRLLKPGGKALLQSIVIDDSHYQRALKEVDYIKRYIFPGSFIPCYSILASSAGKSKLMLEELFDMGSSYAQTLRAWRARFYQNKEAILEQGFDDYFMRMWEFYFCYCEAGFEERAISVGQLLFRRQA